MQIWSYPESVIGNIECQLLPGLSCSGKAPDTAPNTATILYGREYPAAM